MATLPLHDLQHYPPHQSTSRTSLEDLVREEGLARLASQPGKTGGGDKHLGLKGSPTAVAVGRFNSRTGKRKEDGWSVVLQRIAKDGASRRMRERDGVKSTLQGEDKDEGDWPGQRTDVLQKAAKPSRPVEDDHLPAPASIPSVAAPPPPSAQPPLRPERPPLQSILKQPHPAQTPSSEPSQLSFTRPLLPLPSASLTVPSPSALPTPSPSDIELDPKSPALPSPSPSALHHQTTVLFSTPGTTSSIIPLSSPSHSASSSVPSSFPAPDAPADPIGTFRSWKSSVMGRRSGNIDKKRLASLGFEEELNRSYDFWASWSLSMCNIGALPGVTLGVLTALRTGGPRLYSVAWPISGLFMICVAAVLGEMASTFPVAGGPFTWVFRLCRSKKSTDPWARYASWTVGSALLCSHILLQIVVTWQFAHNLLGVITLFTGRHYSFWVTVAICYGICIFSGAVVSSRLSRSPWLWRCCGALIVLFFFTINITLLVHADQIRSASFVFTTFRNKTGFESRSYVYMVGWCLTCVATGMEASAHLAEDTKTPSRTVPLAMFWSTAASYVIGWVTIAVLLATLDTVGLDPQLQPSIALIANSLPRAYTVLILVFVLLSFLFQCVAQLLATSRFIWALARESALPCSTFFRRLSSKSRQPTPAIWITIFIAMPALLLLGIETSIISTTLLEGAGITATASYVCPILLYLFCDKDVLRGDGRAKWTLRGASKPLAVAAAVFLLTFIVTMCLPTGYPVTPLTTSYASVVLLGVLLLSSIAWVLYGNSHYAGPIKTTTRWTIGAEVDLPSSSSHGGTQHQQQQKKKSTAVGAHITTSAAHGRSAHVWATSDAGGGGGRGGETEGASRNMTRGTELSRMTTTTGGTGSEWTEGTETGVSGETGSCEEDEESDEGESEGEEEDGRRRDEEQSVRGHGH
ncbi:hypothetical protein JCM11641_004894 [Rhodosporidiobolus odoratus]